MRLVIVDKRKPKSPIDKYTLYPLIVGFILGLISTMLIPWVVQVITTQPDFIITLDQPSGRAETMESIEVKVDTLDGYDIYHWFHKYENPIALIAYEIGGRTLPTGIEAEFIEQRFKMNGARKVSNKMIITPNEKAKIGHSIIKISGIGGDGRERSCLYDLEVKSQ
jgi:hypothetical protein